MPFLKRSSSPKLNKTSNLEAQPLQAKQEGNSLSDSWSDTNKFGQILKIKRLPNFKQLTRPTWLSSLQESSWIEFLAFLRKYFFKRGYIFFAYLEIVKDLVVGILYKRRGKFARPFLHTAFMSVVFVGITFGPLLVSEATADDENVNSFAINVLRTSTGDTPFVTQQSEEVLRFRGGEVVEHVVAEGETVASISDQYNLSQSTILWENNLSAKSTIKPGDKLRILPIDGVRHKVAKGETVFSLAKKYGLGGDEAAAQALINFPFNTFTDDESFALATGQYIYVPGGVPPAEKSVAPTGVRRLTTPDAGSVTASGQFVWPASGYISQNYSWYHKAIDIAGKASSPILAADSGTVMVSGWIDNSGYGNRVVIDHGNGFVTLYAHMSAVRVQVGQTVNKGDVIGDMGTTGRSTGVHLHFEIRQSGAFLPPLSFLK